MEMLTAQVTFQAQGKNYSVALNTLVNPANRAGDNNGHEIIAIVNIEANKMRAFTLIEMILAIGIAAIVLITVNTVLFASLRLRDETSNMVDAAAPVEQTVTFLRRDLQCVMMPTNGSSGVLSGDFKVGNVSSPGVNDPVAIEMFTADGALSPNAPWGDVQRVTYELKMPADSSALGKNLVRSVVRNLLTQNTPDVEDQLMLTRRQGHHVQLLRRLAMAGHLGHDRPDLDLHQSSARRPRPNPDGTGAGKQQQHPGADSSGRAD